MPLFRVIDVIAQNEFCQVRCLIEDREHLVEWKGEPPVRGQIWEVQGEDLTATPTLISSPSAPWNPASDVMRWRKPLSANGPTRMEILRQRATIRRAVRMALDEGGFTEIEAPLLVRGTTPDIAVESFAVGDRYLVTSTEYQLKRLVVGGMDKIYSLTKNFRADDAGTFRNPEFTMLEWGRVGCSMELIQADAEAVLSKALAALNLGDTLTYQGRKLDMSRPWKRETVAQAVHRVTGVSIDSYTAESCYNAARSAGAIMREEWKTDRNFVFSLLMDAIQPKLGDTGPLFLTRWPAFQTTSANPDSDPFFVDRAELFIAGIELADGFAGLADANLQAYLFDQALAERKRLGMQSVTLDAAYLDAMKQGGPYGAGMAMGFDRLVMLLTDQPTIGSVLAFAWDEV